MGIAVTLRSVFCRPFFAAPFTLGGVPGCVRELFPSCILPACIRFTKASLTTFSGMLKNCCGGEFFSVRHSAGGGCKATGGRTLLARHVLCVMGAGGLFLPGPQKSPGPPSRPKCRAERTLFHSLSERRGLFLRGRQKSPFLWPQKSQKSRSWEADELSKNIRHRGRRTDLCTETGQERVPDEQSGVLVVWRRHEKVRRRWFLYPRWALCHDPPAGFFSGLRTCCGGFEAIGVGDCFRHGVYRPARLWHRAAAVAAVWRVLSRRRAGAGAVDGGVFRDAIYFFAGLGTNK